MGALLTLRGLRRPGLAPVDLDLATGEAVAVMGPSGSGKTLLLRAIADLDPNEGEARLDGADRAAMPAPRWRRQVGYLPAEPGWWADAVAPHFAEPAAAAPLAVRLGLPEGVLDRQVAPLSTGERQRLALIRLLVVGPRVLLLDEPTAGLDAESEARVEALLRERLGAGATILFATHDPAQARRLARRRLAMAGGRATEEAA